MDKREKKRIAHEVRDRMVRERRQGSKGYCIELIGRGEELVYEEGERMLVAYVTYGDGWRLYLNSLKTWKKPQGQRLTAEEKKRVIQRIKDDFAHQRIFIELVES